MKNFSDRENAIMKILGRKSMTFEEISKELFKVTLLRPFDANIAVANAVRRIMDKCTYYKLDWTLTKTREAGKLHIKIKRRKLC